jgi:HK97 family phage portal protein
MKIFGYELKKTTPPVNNEEYQRYMYLMHEFVNGKQPIPIGLTLTEFITKGYAYNPMVYSVVNLRSNAAKGIPWLVYKVKNKNKLKAYNSQKPVDLRAKMILKDGALQEVEGTSLNKLLEHPNPNQSWQDIIEAQFIYRDVVGNAYFFMPTNPNTKKVTHIYTMPADKVKILAGTWLDPVQGYLMQDIRNESIAPENVAHWKYFNPIWQADGRYLYGMPPLVAAAMVVTQENMAMVAQTAAFMNEGLKGIITGTEQTGIEFTKEQAAAMQEKFQKSTGFMNKGKLQFNRAPLNFVKIGETPVDLGILEARRFNKELLCNLYRIHPALLSTDASTLNNMTEARKALLTMSVLPDMDNLRSIINNKIAITHGEEYYVDYDFMAISELQDDIHKLSQTLAGMDWITDNEKRVATQYDNYPDPGADTLYKPMGLMPIGAEFDTGFDRIDQELNKARK